MFTIINIIEFNGTMYTQLYTTHYIVLDVLKFNPIYNVMAIEFMTHKYNR